MFSSWYIIKNNSHTYFSKVDLLQLEKSIIFTNYYYLSNLSLVLIYNSQVNNIKHKALTVVILTEQLIHKTIKYWIKQLLHKYLSSCSVAFSSWTNLNTAFPLIWLITRWKSAVQNTLVSDLNQCGELHKRLALFVTVWLVTFD